MSELAVRVLRRLVRVRRHEVFRADAVSVLNMIEPAVRVELVWADGSNVEKVGEFRPGWVVSSCKRFFARGDRGMLALVEGRCVGHAWAAICTGQNLMAQGYFMLKSREALIHFCHVQTAWRGRRIYSAMISNLARDLLSDGKVDTVFIDAKADNVASLRGIRKAGFSAVGRKTYVQLLNHLVYSRDA